MATHSRIPAWKISWTEEPGGPQSTGSKSWTQLKPLGKHPHTTFHYWIVPADWTTWLKLDNHILPLHNLKLRFVNANLFLLVTWRQHKQLKRLVYGFVYLATYVEKQISVSTERKEWSTSIEPGTEAGNHISPPDLGTFNCILLLKPSASPLKCSMPPPNLLKSLPIL